ncbi:MAG TPA: thiamine-phosphate kinase [Thermoanaerobaculia bacterium]|nr:thiamine-phosphate kinase [Thermoanaerobaculia bacterium]
MNKLRGEDELLRRLRARLGPSALLGDDAAVISTGPAPFAVTVDSQIAGVHFEPDLDPAHVARRLLAVNLSDLAAMGAQPAYAFLALSTPPGFNRDRFFRALVQACQAYEVPLAGGDLARCDQTVATLTLIGAQQKDGRWTLRDGARPGHSLWLGGTVGESAAGRLLMARGARPGSGSTIRLPLGFSAPSRLLSAARRAIRRHLLPSPQLELGQWLARQKEGGSIDVSDGVARDLHRLCRESGCGAEIGAESLPFSDRFGDLCDKLSADPLALALGGGEDYVLLFTLPAEAEPPDSFGCRKIGTITGERKVLWKHRGRRRILPDWGWDHLKTKAPAGPPGLAASEREQVLAE